MTAENVKGRNARTSLLYGIEIAGVKATRVTRGYDGVRCARRRR
jgi:hypothetical protein